VLFAGHFTAVVRERTDSSCWVLLDDDKCPISMPTAGLFDDLMEREQVELVVCRFIVKSVATVAAVQGLFTLLHQR
jgi:hypothetical protein